MVVLAGCGGVESGARSGGAQSAPESYVVRSGDTLFAIARRFGLDHRDIARWNRLGDGTLIYPGQRLRLRGEASAPLGADAAAQAGDLPPRLRSGSGLRRGPSCSVSGSRPGQPQAC